jgi:hypothetical protein
MLIPDQPFQPCLMIWGKARSLTYSGALGKELHSGRPRPYAHGLDQAGKVCQGQTLYLIMNITKIWT